MHLLLCAATSFEIQPTIDFIREQKIRADIMITGVGLMSTTHQLTRALCVNRPELVIQAGVAGSIDPALTLANVYAVRSECTGDLGVEEGGAFKSIFDLGLARKEEKPWQDGKLVNPHQTLHDLSLPWVDAVSVNEVSTNPGRIGYYASLGAQIESMEGAALHWVGLQENIPFLQLRSLSNFVGERDKSRWRMQEALTSLNRELQELLIKMMNP